MANYNYDNNGVARVRAHDQSFGVYFHLSETPDDSHYEFLMRNENPRNHFVTFTRPDTVALLTCNGNPPSLHEVIDGRRPFRLCFDIEKEIDITCNMDEFFSEFNAQRQEDEDLDAELCGRVPVQLAPVQVTAEMFYAAKVTPLRDAFVQHIQANLVDAVNMTINNHFASRMTLDDRGHPIETEETEVPFLTAADIMLFDSSAICPRMICGTAHKPKLSFHVIFARLFVCDCDEGIAITHAVADYLSESVETRELASAIDKKVIKSLFMLRIPGAAKPDEPMRILQAYGAPVRTVAANYMHALVQQGVQNINLAVCVRGQRAPERVLHAAEMINAPEVVATLVARYPDYFAGYAFLSFEHNIIRFMRVGETSECVFCKRVHDNDNAAYILVKHGRYYLRCRRVPRGQPHGLELRLADFVGINPEEFPEHLRRMKIITAQSYPSRTVCINQEFIGFTINEQLERTSTVLIRSPMGTGKTYALKTVIEQIEATPQTIMMISFRRAFTLEKAAELKFDHYLNYPDKELPESPARFICQYESLYRMHEDYTPSVLIIDEIESINEQIQSFQLNGGLALEALARLHYYVKNAEYVIVMDANLSQSSANYFIKERARDRPVIVVNEFKREREVTAYGCEANLTGVIRARAQLARVGVCSDSRTYLQSLEKMLVADGIPAEQIKIVTSDNATEFQQEIIAAGSITELVKRYRVFGYNTTLLAGISIEDAELSEQYACFTENFITPTAAFQLIGRIRAMTTLGIFIAQQRVVPITFDQEVARTFCLKSMSFADMLRAGRKLTPLPRMLARHRVRMNNARARLLESILALWHDTGARINYVAGAAGDASARVHFNATREVRAQKIAAASCKGTNTFDKKLNDIVITYGLHDVVSDKRPLPVDLVTQLQKPARVSAWKGLTYLNHMGDLNSLRVSAQDRLSATSAASAENAQVTLANNDACKDIVACVTALELFGADMASCLFETPVKTHEEYSALIKQISGSDDVQYAARKLNTQLEHTFGVKIASTTRTKKGRGGYKVVPIADSIFGYHDGRWRLNYAVAKKAEINAELAAGADLAHLAEVPVEVPVEENVARVEPME